MGIIGSVVRAYLIDRLVRGRSHRDSRYARGNRGPYARTRRAHDEPFYPTRGPSGWGSAGVPGYGLPYGGPRARRRSGVRFFGPLPYYSTTTRRGTRVSVGGCCLPIPLLFLASVAAALATGARLRRRDGS